MSSGGILGPSLYSQTQVLWDQQLTAAMELGAP